MTLRYPESKLMLPEGYRYPRTGYKGRHLLDMEKCTGCSICAITCRNITGAIKMVEVEGAFPRNKKSIFPRIDYGYCVFCGFCVDVCVFLALTMTSEYELAAYDKRQLIYEPRSLTVPPPPAGNASFVLERTVAYHKNTNPGDRQINQTDSSELLDSRSVGMHHHN